VVAARRKWPRGVQSDGHPPLSTIVIIREILLQDTAKMHNMLMDTAKTRICPKTPQIRGSLPRHCTDYFNHFSDLRREKLGEMTLLSSSSTSGWSLIFAITHCRRLFFSGEVSSCSPAPASPPPPRAASLTRRHLGILWWAETSTGPSSSSLHGHGSHGGAAAHARGREGLRPGSPAIWPAARQG